MCTPRHRSLNALSKVVLDFVQDDRGVVDGVDLCSCKWERVLHIRVRCAFVVGYSYTGSCDDAYHSRKTLDVLVGVCMCLIRRLTLDRS